MSNLYTNRSNANRAAKKQGLTSFAVVPALGSPGKFAIEVTAINLAPVAPVDAPAKPAKAPKVKSASTFIRNKIGERVRKEQVARNRGELVAVLPPSFAPVADVHTSPKAAGKIVKRHGAAEAGYQIEKDRAVANDQVRPSSTTVGGNLWAIYDALVPVVGGVKQVTAQMAREAALKVAINGTSATIAFYRWRKFNGVRGRANLKKAQPKAAK